jgi:hypothetical protein
MPNNLGGQIEKRATCDECYCKKDTKNDDERRALHEDCHNVRVARALLCAEDADNPVAMHEQACHDDSRPN